MRKRDHNVMTNAASLLICGLLAGVVVAAAAFPAVAMSGLAAKAGADTFDKLPTELTIKKSPQISYLYASDGRTPLATMYDENRRDVPFKSISPNMIHAIVAAEDHEFYKHNGVDMKGVARAFVNNNQGGNQQGASTLTMQYVRLAIAYSADSPEEVIAATEDTPARKLKEMKYALQIDRDLGKDEILERYLNIAPFGNGAYGIFAASQVYFGKQPKDLKIEEAALLAGLVKAPTTFDPTTATGKPQALDRRNYVIKDMVETGAITQKQADAAIATKLVVKDKRTPNGCVSTTKNSWGFFCDFFYRWWMDQETFGATTFDRERRLKSGGYSIVTTLDPKVQDAAKKNADKSVSVNNPHAVMLAAVEPGSGRVRALAVNRNYKIDDPRHPQNKLSSNPDKKRQGKRGSYPNTTNPLLTGGGDITGYQAGSTFKIFTLVAALEKGLPLSYPINAPVQYVSNFMIDPSGDAACQGGHYCPTNSSPSMAGMHNMWTGFGASVNTYFVPLEEQVGADRVVNVAKRLGIQFRSKADADLANNGADQWGAFTLGVSSTTPLDLANAYATLAADGKYCKPIPVQEIRDQDGQKLDVANPQCNKAVDVQVARSAVDAARCPVGDHSSTSKCAGTGTAKNVRGIVGHPVAGKSGTTDSDWTSSLVAMTKQLAVAGIEADPEWPTTTHKMLHDEPGGINPPVYYTLRDAMKGEKSIEFTPPSGKLIAGDMKSIPDVKCQSQDSARSRLKDAGFEVDNAKNPVNSSCPAGTVAGTDPSDRTVKGGTVIMKISNGQGDGGNNDQKPDPRGPNRPRGN